MNRETERPREEDLADCLWRAITALQAMTGRLLDQHERTARGQDADAYGLSHLPVARASGPGVPVLRR